jgi:serine/threonine protein kinase
MGEVYRARDTRLERTVAVKVLPSHLSASAEVRQRFEREAKTISSLSHPHICALYDVGNQDGVEFLVMEYLEGDTLSERLTWTRDGRFLVYHTICQRPRFCGNWVT